jgi:tRNA (cytidine/uridine-2'-O-)-methyltransferase
MVFGPETRGISMEVLDANRDRCLTIPMPSGKVRSLNLSTSAGIVLYEAIRQLAFIR